MKSLPCQENKEKSIPHYHGHRARLRERFSRACQSGFEAVADYELLELVLFLAIPRGDTKPLAKELLDKFKTFQALLQAEQEQVLAVSGAGSNVVHVLRLVQAVISKTLQQQIIRKPILDSWQMALEYCYATMAYDQRESLRVLFLDNRNQLVGEEVQQRGTINHVAIYPREIIRRVLELGASALILVHNHPSGDPEPSPEDIEATLQLQKAGLLFNIEVHDHLIIGKGRYCSLKSMGLF